MAYQDCKVYFDGGHYIAVPKENFPSRKGRNIPKKNSPQTDTKKAKFEKAYAESQVLPKRDRKQYIAEQLKDEFISEEQTKEYVKQQTERKRNNNILILNTYIDHAMTGTNDNRPDFQRMIKDSSRKEWNYVLVYKLDRFSRNKYETAILVLDINIDFA